MPTATQDNRLAEVKSPLGGDKLLLHRMSYTEHLSEPYVLELDVLSEDAEIKLDDLLGKSLTVTLTLPDGSDRHYSGLVSQFGFAGMEGRYFRYRAVCRPWLWFLTRTSDCRIFQEKTVPDILLEVFRKYGFSDFKKKLSGSYRTWNYCVQYRESAFAFVSRLMEQEGIYYYFEHEDGKHQLVLADDVGSHAPAPAAGQVPYLPPSAERAGDRERVFRWSVVREVESGDYVVNSYDFEKPGADLVGKATVKRNHAGADHEVYDYPADYTEAGDGETYAQVRIQELQVPWEVAEAATTARGIQAGFLTELTDHPRSDQNREYLVLSTRQELVVDEYESAQGEPYVYACDFTAMSSRERFRPARVTPKPRVRGPQTAVVVGKSGEEIWTDKYGRVKVQFHWDRYGEDDENSSCWVRVAQMWAGSSWGHLHVPRVNEEVIVEFLDGDPDRPIVTGRVYNAKRMPPYALPANQTRFVLKTRSSPDGSEENFNELRIEDKKDAEEIYFHAEKDFNRVVENNDTLKVGFEKKDKGDQTIDILNDRTVTLDSGNETFTVKKGNRTVSIDQGDDSLTVGKGNLTIKVNTGKIEIEAMQSIRLKVGGSTLVLEPAKITMKSPQIQIQADTTLEVKCLETTVQGDGMLTLKGGMVKIN